jgi:ATP-dependent Clp protease protease subunit
MENNKAKPWRFANSAGQLDLYLYGEISTSDDLDGGATATSFLSDLKAAGPISRVNLHINSGGGSVFAATAIHNLLRGSGAKIACSIDGLCASAATLVAMAGDSIAMPRNALFMVHLPSVSLFSAQSGELKRMANVLDQLTSQMIEMYRRHSPLSAAQIRELLVAESWMDAPTALGQGFITDISDESPDLSVAACADLSRYKNVPEQIAARVQRKADPTPEYIPEFSGRSLAEIDAEHERLRLRRRLRAMTQ